MRNATDTRDYIVQGFKDLRARLDHQDEAAEISKRIRLNTAAREKAIARVRSEYAGLGREPPSDLALSIIARRAFGIGTETLTYISDEAAA